MGNAPSNNTDEDLVKRVDDLLFQIGDLENKIALLTNDQKAASLAISDLARNNSAINKTLDSVITYQNDIGKSVETIIRYQNDADKKQTEIINQVNTLTDAQQTSTGSSDLAIRVSQSERDVTDLFDKLKQMIEYVNTLPTTESLTTEFEDIDKAIAQVASKSPLGFFVAHAIQSGMGSGQLINFTMSKSSRGSFVSSTPGVGVSINETGIYYIQVTLAILSHGPKNWATWSLTGPGMNVSANCVVNSDSGEISGNTVSQMIEVKKTPYTFKVSCDFVYLVKDFAIWASQTSNMLVVRIGDV